MAGDLYSNCKVSRVISPHSPAATGTISGVVIDTSGFRTTTFVIAAGAQTTTGVTVVPIVTSGAATGALTSAAASELIGTEAGSSLSGAAGADGVTRIGYIGIDRYVTCDLAVAAAATGLYAVTCVQSDPIKGPQA
jgi:hypothetical protein